MISTNPAIDAYYAEINKRLLEPLKNRPYVRQVSTEDREDRRVVVVQLEIPLMTIRELFDLGSIAKATERYQARVEAIFRDREEAAALVETADRMVL